MASKDKKYQLSEGRKKQFEQARQNAKNASKQSKPASNYLGGSTKKTTTTTTKKTSGTQSRSNTVSRSTGKSTVTNRNVKQADKVNSARPYQQSARSLGNTVGITREGQKQRQETARQNTARSALQTAKSNGTLKSTGTISAPAKTNTLPKANAAKRTSGTMSGGTARKTGKTWNEQEERQKAIDTLNANSVAWNNTSNQQEKTRLHAENNRIRQKFGMSYDDDTGTTYLPTASGGRNTISKPVVQIARGANYGKSFNTQAQRDARYNELNSEIDRMQKQYPYLIAMDQRNRSLPDQLAGAAYLATHPKMAISGINGDDQYNKMSAANKKQADAMYQLYKRLNDEANAISKQSAGKSIATGLANTGLNITGAVENAGRWISATGNKAAGNFLSFVGAKDAGNFLQNTAQKTLEGSVSGAAMQRVNDWAQPVGMAKQGEELAGSAARMVPGIAANAALPGASLAMIYADSAKGGAQEALQDGANLDQAMAYGTGSGLVELGTEKMFGGIPGMGEGAVKTGSGILGRAADILGEGVEEATSTFVNPYLKRATYDKNAQNATAQELWDSAKGGIATSLLMEGASGLANRLADRRYGAAPAEPYTTPAEANRDMDIRSAWLNNNETQALPVGETRLALPEGTNRAANTIYAGQQGAAYNQRAFNNVNTPDVLYGNSSGGVSDSLNAFPNVFYASQNGQVSDSLPTQYLPEGRSTQTKISMDAQTKTFPFIDLENDNGGMYRSDMEWAKLLIDNSNKTGIPIKQYITEIVDPTMQEMETVRKAAEQYVRDYKGQGVSIIRNDDGTDYRASNNEDWYSQFYKKNGRKPRKSEAADIAQQFIQHDLSQGGGSWVSPELARDYGIAQSIQAAYDALGDAKYTGAKITPNGLEVTTGGKTRTADIRDTNAGRSAYVSPATQGTPQAPLFTGTGAGVSGTANTQNAPSLSDVRQQQASLAAKDISPKLTRAGAETAQGAPQTAPQGITQAAGENAQSANVNDIRPKLQKAVAPESSVGAAEGGFDPYSRMVNEYGAIPEGENPARIVDVPQSTNGEDRVMAGTRTVMEATVTSDEVIAALQDEVAKGNLSREVVRDETAMAKAAERVANTSDKVAAIDTLDKIARGEVPNTKDDVAYGQALLAYFNKVGDVQNATRVASDLIVQSSLAGRILQSGRMLKKLSPEGRVMTAVKMVEGAQKAVNDRYGKKAPQITISEDLVRELQSVDAEQAPKVLNEVMKDVANQLPNTWWDKYDALRYTSMLTSLPTHIRNVLGNVMMRQLAVKPKNAIGAVLETAADKVSRARGGEGIERTKSLTTNKEDRAFARTEFDKMQQELSGSKYDMTSYDALQRAKDNPFSGGILGKLHLDKPLNWIDNKNSTALEYEDTLAKRTTYIDSMAQYMKANNLTAADMYNELGGETDALLKAREYATNEALKATFQDANILAKWLQEGEKKLGKPGQIVIGGLIPFKKTPANIVKRGLEYSPLGILKGVNEAVDSVRTGNTTPAQAIDSLSAGLTGTGIMALGYFLGGMGVLRAGDDEDKKKQYFDEMQGEQSYSLNVGDYSYTIDWAAPAVLPLFVGAELQKYLSNKDNGFTFEDFTKSLSRITEPVFDLTMMQGINDAIRSASYGDGAEVTSMLSSMATDYFTQGLAPTALGQINRSFFDRTRRTTYPDANNNIPDGLEKVMQRTMQKIPGLSQKLPKALDDFGREQENNPWWENFFSPGYLEKKSSTDAEKALSALYDATGDNSILPSKPQKTYKDEKTGKTVHLSSDQWLDLTNTEGKTALSAIDKLTKSAAYKNMTNAEKVDAIADVYKYASAIAANKVYGKTLQSTIQTVKDSGIEPGLYYAYKEMEDTYNDSMETYEARDQVFNAIKNDGSLTDKEKNGLYHTLLIKGTSASQWDKYQEVSDKVTAEEFVDAMIQKQAISKEGEDIDKGRAAAEATEFSYYLDAKGYTGAKREALENTFKFYSMVKADPANYTFDMIRENGGTKEKAAIGEVESAGISASQYAKIKTAASGVTYEKGKKNAKIAAVGAAVSQNTTSYEQYAAVMHALGYKNIDGYYKSGGKLPEDKKGDTGISVNRATSSAGFVNPTSASNAVITSQYGGRQSVKTSTGYSSSDHDGIDIGGTGGNLDGQEADTIGGGKVIAVGYESEGYGNYVEVDHGNGYTSLYGHLQKATVKQGDTVSAGQQIGIIGSTGSSTAPHLHLRVHKNGQSIDPRTVIPGFGK